MSMAWVRQKQETKIMKTVNPTDGTKHSCSKTIRTFTTWSARWTKLHVHCCNSYKVWCWMRTENNGRTDRVINRVKGKRNILHTTKLQKANWIGNILHRNCLLKHVIEGNTGGMKRQGRRRKQLLDACKEKSTHESERESIRSHSRELTLEQAMDLVQHRLCNEHDEHSLQIQ
jgi:hypothetical protein